MFKSFTVLAVAASSALLLSACGGGGGDDTSPTGRTEDDTITSDDGPTPGFEDSTQNTDIDFSAVEGVYDASVSVDGAVDENYLVINSSGEISAYNYTGDNVDMGDNCYRSAEDGEINYHLDGKLISALSDEVLDESDVDPSLGLQLFTVDLKGDSSATGALSWQIAENMVEALSWIEESGDTMMRDDGTFFSVFSVDPNSVLRVEQNNVRMIVPLETTTAIAVSDIESAVCQ